MELHNWLDELSPGADVAAPAEPLGKNYVQDAEIPPEIREVFIEEADEIVVELTRLVGEWEEDPRINDVLRDIRRHFHTFKGNGRAVGANVLGELGWAAQDMLDRVLDGDLPLDHKIRALVGEVVAALPSLVMSYRDDAEPEVSSTRELTDRCFLVASGGGKAPAPAREPSDENPGDPAGGVAQLSLSESISH